MFKIWVSKSEYCADCVLNYPISEPIVTFHIETSHLIYIENKMTGFFIKCNTGLERVKIKDTGTMSVDYIASYC